MTRARCENCGAMFDDPDGWLSMYCPECIDWFEWKEEQDRREAGPYESEQRWEYL